MDDGFSLSEEGNGRVLFDENDPVSCWNENDDTVEV